MSKTKISIVNYGKSLERAKRLIEKFKIRNNMDFSLQIKIDFDFKDLGYYVYNDNDKSIYVNPINCKNRELKGELVGHPNDYSLCSVIMHEFSHFIDDKLLIEEKYSDMNFKKNLAVTKYSLTNKSEELADLMAVYMINPYFVYLVDVERFNWLKRIIRSPGPFGKKTFIKNYNKWPMSTKVIAYDIYGFKINKNGNILIDKPKFVFTKIEKNKVIMVRTDSKNLSKSDKKLQIKHRGFFHGIKKNY